MFKSQDIICITLSDWDEPKRCRHHLMSILAKNNRVLFVERAISFFGLFKGKNEWKRLLRVFKGIRHQQDGLFLLTPPVILPGGDWILWINSINQKIIGLFVKLAVRKINFAKPILWIFSYTAGDLVGRFREKISLYYCNDPFEKFAPHGKKREGILNIERKLIGKADYFFPVSNDLIREKGMFNKKTYLIPHGVRVELSGAGGTSIPKDILSLKGIKVGYIGTLNDKLDYELLVFMARNKKDWNIVLIGPVAEIEAEQQKRLKKLKELNNVYLLGNRSQNELPAYYHAMDVLVLPYLENEFSATFWVPLKFYEYLAGGRPVVSSIELEGAQNYDEDIIRFSKNAEEFVQQVERCISDDNEAMVQKRIAVARENTWESRLNKIFSYIKERS